MRRFRGAKKSVMNEAKKKMLEDRGALFKEEGDLVREYTAMHEDNFFCIWLRSDEEGRAREGEVMRQKMKAGGGDR